MRILMVASEATPFAKTGGLGDVVGSLPAALAARGDQVAVVMPAYDSNRYPHPTREVWRSLSVPLEPGFLVDIRELMLDGVTFYFVECPPLFHRGQLYGSGDDYLRFAVLSLAALGVVRHLFRPEIIHCHDWQAALVPVYARRYFAGDPSLMGVRILFTIHNLRFQGRFWEGALAQVGLGRDLFTSDLMEFYGDVNFMKGAIAFSDAISTVSPTYAREIQTPEYGEGLDGFLRIRSERIFGILNGVDYSVWSPEVDPFLPAHFSDENLAGKLECKRRLLAQLGFPPEAMERPILAVISRLDGGQKGMELIADIIWSLLDNDITFILLGSGDAVLENFFRGVERARHDKARCWIGFDNGMAHHIEAGADIFLMPSRYEPCGLNQMYSLKYGTPPVVRATGGLNDTIDEDTGFKFGPYAGWALWDAIDRAITAYGDRDGWTVRMRRGMTKDFSWAASAAQYSELYMNRLRRF
jgi:starch synthase